MKPNLLLKHFSAESSAGITSLASGTDVFSDSRVDRCFGRLGAVSSFGNESVSNDQRRSDDW